MSEMSKELEKMRKELKEKIGILVLVTFAVVVAVAYYGRDWFKYRIELYEFRKVIDQCSTEVGERDERATEKELQGLIEECVKAKNTNSRFKFSAGP